MEDLPSTNKHGQRRTDASELCLQGALLSTVAMVFVPLGAGQLLSGYRFLWGWDCSVPVHLCMVTVRITIQWHSKSTNEEIP